MATPKRRSASSLGVGLYLLRLLLRPQYRGSILTVAVVLGSIGLAIYGWQRWGEPATRSDEYLVMADQIAVTPQPGWIHENVKNEVLRSLGAAELSLGDRGLVQKVAEAFQLHPWVAQVVRVQKRNPSEVVVDLVYRRPALVVKIDAQDERGLLFLDEASVLLPSADFASGQAKSYLRILAAGETPASVYGTAWGSERMLGACQIAAAWGDKWQPLGLYWISATRSASGGLIYEMRTQDDKVRIVWGSAIGHEATGESSPSQKIARLEQYVHDKGALDKNPPGGVVDLRVP
jgi:hypothetical protein